MRRERLGFLGEGREEGDVVSLFWLCFASGERGGLEMPGVFEEDVGVVVAMLAGRLRSRSPLRLGSKRRATRDMGLSNFRLGKL